MSDSGEGSFAHHAADAVVGEAYPLKSFRSDSVDVDDESGMSDMYDNDSDDDIYNNNTEAKRPRASFSSGSSYDLMNLSGSSGDTSGSSSDSSIDLHSSRTRDFLDTEVRRMRGSLERHRKRFRLELKDYRQMIADIIAAISRMVTRHENKTQSLEKEYVSLTKLLKNRIPSILELSKEFCLARTDVEDEKKMLCDFVKSVDNAINEADIGSTATMENASGSDANVSTSERVESDPA